MSEDAPIEPYGIDEAGRLVGKLPDGKVIDFILYKVKFEPIKFNYWNKWYKKLARKLLGEKRAFWLFYRDAIKLTYGK